MTRLIARSLAVAALAALVCLTHTGCRRPPKQPSADVKGPTENPGNVSFGAQVVAAFRYEPKSVNDEWTRFRDLLPKLNAHMSKADVQSRVKLSEEDRKFLSDDAHLTGPEISDLETPEFRTADAHYLDECYLMRDAARAADAGNFDSVEKHAAALFRWMSRNVYLHEAVETWVPPAYTLRRGIGGPIERALVYLALLRQEKFDGCLVVVPGTDPLQFVLGVVDPQASDLRLFDTRLGLPVAGKTPGSIATLKEVQADPKLLATSQITPEQTKKLEVWLACPLHAMAPRMLELQGEVAGLDRIVFYQNPREVARDVGKVTSLPIKVWNPPAQGSKIVPSPTRCLDLFLPKQEGGQDTTNRALQVSQARLPVGNVALNLGQINVTPNVLGSAYSRIDGAVGDLFVKYELQPREMYLHGNGAAMSQRLARIQPLLKTDVSVKDKVFANELDTWFKLMKFASGNLIQDDPAIKNKAQQIIDNLGGIDFVLHWTRDVDNEKTLADLEREINARGGDRQLAVSTKILALGIRDQLEPEVQRLQAVASHEKAERAQAILRGKINPSDTIVRNAEEDWITAKSAWKNFYLAPIALDFMIDQRLAQMRARSPIAESAGEKIGLRISLLETLHLDVQRYFNAKVLLAECLVHTEKEGVKSAKEYLLKTKKEIEEVEKKGKLRDEIRTLRVVAQRFPPPARETLLRRLDLLSHDWTEKGTMYWLKQQIDQRVQ